MLMVEKVQPHEVGHLFELFIIGDEPTREVEAMSRVFNIYCDGC